MFGVLQGDHFLIASFYTMTDLGPYAAAAALAMAPTFFFGRVFSSVMLPVMADVQENTAEFTRRYRQVLAVITLFAMVCALGMMLGAEALMRVIYGPKYAGAGVLLAYLSAANAFRTLRVAPALAAIAKGDSQNQMISNCWRVIALVPALGLAMAHAPLWSIAGCGLVGEAGACWISLRRLRRRDAVPLTSSLIPTGWILAAVTVAGGAAAAGLYSLPTTVGMLLAATGVCVGAAGIIVALPELRHEAAKLYGIWRQVGWRGCLRGLSHRESAGKTAA
jgi:O-antigen/teichoic acid export membrane protein